MERGFEIGQLSMKKFLIIAQIIVSVVMHSQTTGYVLKNADGTTDLPDSAISITKIKGLLLLLGSYSVSSHVHTYSSLTSRPTTLLGYGITDAAALVHSHAYNTLTGVPLTFTPSSHTHAEGEVTGLVNDLAAKQSTLVSGNNIKTVNGNSLLGSTDIVTTRKVAQVDIAATSSATSTTTIFTPSASGMYRLSVYLKISTTGTSPVAGPVTITYQDADGSVAQSHVMLLQSVTGTVVTTTVNNSTTTGTVNGSMIINAKTGVAITYAIAVSGTFGAGRYVAHITLEQL